MNTEFLEFLVEAKRRTYAAQDVAQVRKKPLLTGSTQLEWASGDWLYRDIYFGSDHFTGQETVFNKNKPYWSMCYSGGMNGKTEALEAVGIYDFLKSALGGVSVECPFRGPENYTDGNLTYQAITNGDIRRFDGKEEILMNDLPRYVLFYAGGFVL